MEEKSGKDPKNHGQNIGDIVRSTLETGDWKRLKDLGPAIEDAVKEIPGVRMETRKSNPPAVRTEQRPAQKAAANARQPAAEARQQTPWKGSGQRYLPEAPKGVVRIVFGVMGVVGFGLAAVAMAILALFTGGAIFTPLLAVFGLAAAACAGLLGSGLSKNKKGKLAKGYYDLFRKKPVLTMVEVAAATGKTPRQVRKDYKKLRRAGLFQDVFMDEEETCLMRGQEAWQQYLESQKTMAQRMAEAAERQRRLEDPATAPIEAFRSKGLETIRQIRNANEAIPGEEISDKLSRLEGTCARIFSYVEQYPEKLPETRKFMDYYLPTTLKLVEKYQQFEAMDYQPDNVKQAKREIERSLDTIDLAFNNMLESLYQHETLDVATDIEVLEKMLEQEGLTGSRFEIEIEGNETITLE